MTSISKLYEPSPRFSHSAAPVGERCYLRGGYVQDFSASGRRKLTSTVEIFDPHLETWVEHPTTGVPPPGLYDGACTSLLDSLYWFGGWDGSSRYNSLHRLDITTLEWKELLPLNQIFGPMRKDGCVIVPFLQDQLAVFGGYGIPVGPTQPGAMFTKDTHFTDGRGWSNELHMFSITEGKWSSPPTTGPRPPPCGNFSFTTINDYQAVFFGGYQPGRGCRVNDCYLLNFQSMEWTKLEKPEGAPWPVERSAHATCCVNYGEEHPQLLVTGGIDNNHNTLQDVWILDVNSGRWRELTLPEGAQPRLWHTATALSLGLGRTQVTMFGGCPKFERGKSYDALQKLAKTTVLEFESVELPPSGDSPSTREWVLVGVADSSQLGSTKRLPELVKMKRKAEHAHMREIEELKKQIHQLEDELALAQRQSRLALARAVRAEIETDKIPVLEQQLSQTNSNLEAQIHMKDEARIAAEQQLQQTKATLEHEIQMAEWQFNQEKAGLQHEIQERDQKISSLQQQIYQTEKFLEHHKQAAMSAHQQFSHHVKNLERQIEVTEQTRVALEMQVQDREKAELEHQLHQKEEQIEAKDKENVELEQKICQIKEHHPPEVTQVTEMQQEGSGYVKAQGAVPSESHYKQSRIETLTADKQELIRQVHTLEAKLEEEKFFRDHYSQEVDQLRDELMDKIVENEYLTKQHKDVVTADTLPTTSPAGGSDKMEVKDQNVQTNTLEMKDQNTQTEIVQINDQPVQAESTTQQQGTGSREVEMNDQKIQTETLEPMEPHVETRNMTQQQGKVELKDQQAKNETVDQQVQAEETVHQLQEEYLRGFETFAETNFNITDSHAHTFEWQRYGLKLHIPEGTVPTEHAECKIDIKVGLAGQFRIPDDLQLVSCIYWLHGPQRPFLKPVTLEVEHCASLQDSSQSESLRFVVAKCSQTELPYQFRELKKGTFVPESSYGSIQVSQFSIFGITISRRSSRLSQYYSAVFYIQKGLNWWHVDFVITLHLRGSLEAIRHKYSKLAAISGPDFIVQFENETISLEILEDGICLENGWTITPLVLPVINKQQVDGFKPGRRAPYCRLQVKLDKKEKPTELKHKVKLQGAKSPFDFFTITCPPEECIESQTGVSSGQGTHFGGSEQGVVKKRHFSDDTHTSSPVAVDDDRLFSPKCGSPTPSPRDSSSETVGQEEATTLCEGTERAPTKPQFKDLMDALYHKVADRWRTIGLYLEIAKGKLAGIAEKYQNDPQNCLVAMLETWEERVNPPATWAAIIEAVEFLGEEQLGKELRKKYAL